MQGSAVRLFFADSGGVGRRRLARVQSSEQECDVEIIFHPHTDMSFGVD
jgi:hypothetical protein